MQNAAQTRTRQTTESTSAQDSAKSAGLFTVWSESKLSFKHIASRIIFAILFFIIIDSIIGLVFQSQTDTAFESRYRFPIGTDIAPIRLYVEHIRKTHSATADNETAANDRQSTNRQSTQQPLEMIAFLGSSPTYGHRIKKAANTYPYVFENEINRNASKAYKSSNAFEVSKAPDVPIRQSNSSKNVSSIDKRTVNNNATDNSKSGNRAIKVYNLASNGQLVSDQYFIAKALIDDVDTFVVQLNYHTFNGSDDKRPAIRYADLPKRLGIPIAKNEESLLGIKSSFQSNINSALSRTVSSISFTYAQRDFITGKLFGGPPESLLLRFLPDKSNNSSEKEELFGEANKPFSELSSVQQMLIIKRVSNLYDYKIKSDDHEIKFLKKLVDLISSHKKKAIFFITPLNIEALDEYGLFSWDAYDSNSKILETIVERKGFMFLDANAGTGMVPADQFFDVSHTLDTGGKTFGKQLAQKSKNYILKGETGK